MSGREASLAQYDLPPTEAEPEAGCAQVSVAGEEIVLSEAIRWVEPYGDHVIRSLEFDVIAGAPTFEQALSKFIDSLFDFAVYLAEVDDPAENEEEMFHRLAPRVLRFSRALERCLGTPRKRRLIPVNLSLGRRSHQDVREWLPSSRQRGSRLPSPV